MKSVIFIYLEKEKIIIIEIHPKRESNKGIRHELKRRGIGIIFTPCMTFYLK